MKKIVILICFLLLKYSSYSQDIHFSQFNQTPSLVNPALTGVSSVLRASVIYRDQWRSVTTPFQTYGASVEMKFKGSNWDKAGQHMTKIYKKAFNRLAEDFPFSVIRLVMEIWEQHR